MVTKVTILLTIIQKLRQKRNFKSFLNNLTVIYGFCVVFYVYFSSEIPIPTDF